MNCKSIVVVIAILAPTFAGAKDCQAECKDKSGKVDRTMKWTCPDNKSCSADCTTGKTACADPLTLKPLPGEKPDKKK